MLNLFYDCDLDYLEVFFEKTLNYGDDLSPHLIAFKSEKNDKVVGYGIFNPKKNISSFEFLNFKMKIAVLCFINRKNLGLSERETAAKLDLSYRTYQRIEEGGISKIDDLLKISSFVKGMNFSKIFKAS